MENDLKSRLVETLKHAQTLMMELSGRYAVDEQDWAKAKSLFESVRLLGSIMEQVTGQVPAAQAPTTDVAPHKTQYCIDRDRLVKVGRGSQGGAYEHRVRKQNYEKIALALDELAKQGDRFRTRVLVDRCSPMPSFEPLIVVNLLSEHGLLKSPRRGLWEFQAKTDFTKAAQDIWNNLHVRE